MSATHPPSLANHKPAKPSLYGGGQRKYNHLHKFQVGTTTTWSGYTNYTGKPLFNSNRHTNHHSKNSINVQSKPTISHLSKDKNTTQPMKLMSINPNDILFRQPPRKNTVSMQQAQQMYQHQQQISIKINPDQYYKNTMNHQYQSRSNHQYQSRSRSNHQYQSRSRSNHQSRSRSNHQYQYKSQSNHQSRSRSRSNHLHQNNKPYVTHRTHYNNRRSQDSREKTHSHSHSRSPSYNRKSLLLSSKTQSKIIPTTTTTLTSTSKKFIHGIILSDSMASKCRMFKVNISNLINVELIAKSGCNCERMADWMASVEGKTKLNNTSVVLFSLGTNDIAQLGVDLTLKRCQWLIEYTRRNFPGIQTIGWMKLSPRWKSSRFFSGHEFTNLHREFNNRLYVLSKEINIDVIDAKLQIEDIRIQDGLHPTLSSGRQKFENVQRQWFAQQAMHLSKTTVQQQQHNNNKRIIITTMNNNNLTNLLSSQQKQQQAKITIGQVQLNSTQPFVVNYTKNIAKHITSEKYFHHPYLPSRQLIKFYPHKLKHPNQLFRESTPPENIDKDKVFLIANLYYQYRHFEDDAKKWRVYETVASRKETQQKRTIHFYHSNYERENNLTNNNNTIDREIPEVRIGPTSPRWSGNETFDSETNGENKEKESKKRKLSDTSLSPIGLNIRTREDMSNIQMDEEDGQEQVIEHYDPLTQSTPTGHNLSQSPNVSVYTQRVIRRSSTNIEIESPSVVSKDTYIEELHSFDFPIIPFECKYTLGNNCNAESIKIHRIFIEKKTEQMETKLNNEMEKIPIEQGRILKQYIINNIDPIVDTFKKTNRKRIDNLILDQMKEKAIRQIKNKCRIDELEKVKKLEEQYMRMLNLRFQLRKLEKRLNLNMPPPYLNAIDKLQLRSKELDRNEIEQFTEQWNNIIRHAKKDFTSIMIMTKTAEIEKIEKKYQESLERLPEYIREPFDTLIHTIKIRHDQTTEKKIHFLERKTYRMRET
ncbi:unnamed protein product [Rotaria sp. Silwood1]|nr:unnamed protein product [Rotaria sp. Silwood1]CAF3829020.1 unnamed protein product [Rotaria sp. Silwood1]CAF3989184.1 unnamed protein product [Rotaria sp. Silwood1]CAF4851756.1 unnamed protein product [Rotaria sp. Silwood1]CAF4948806.1 unnamed protein product [Rotaria sp. Silwood1]